MNKDNVIKKKRWEFDEEVTNCFENMISRSIPDYNTMRETTYNLVYEFLDKDSLILDIGCSKGDSIDKYIKDNYNIIGIDISEDMIKQVKEKYKDYNNVTFFNKDILEYNTDNKFKVIQSVFTIQFTPIEYRQQILEKIYNLLEDNGIFIFIEKILDEDTYIDNLFYKKYYDIKRKNGYTEEQIYSKKKSLEKELIPIKAKWNEELLKEVGFKHIASYWKTYNFQAWIAIK